MRHSLNKVQKFKIITMHCINFVSVLGGWEFGETMKELCVINLPKKDIHVW